jgi:hypothetical protein
MEWGKMGNLPNWGEFLNVKKRLNFLEERFCWIKIECNMKGMAGE